MCWVGSEEVNEGRRWKGEVLKKRVFFWLKVQVEKSQGRRRVRAGADWAPPLADWAPVTPGSFGTLVLLFFSLSFLSLLTQ